MIKKITKYLPKKFKNKWVLSGLALFVWLLFFEEINIISLVRAKVKISNLEFEWKISEDKIKESQEKKALIKQDVEKYARETFWMKKDNEELFILPEEKK